MFRNKYWLIFISMIFVANITPIIFDSFIVRVACLFSIIFVSPKCAKPVNRIEALNRISLFVTVMLGILTLYISTKMTLTADEFNCVNKRLGAVLYNQYCITGLSIIKIIYHGISQIINSSKNVT
jgi:hypothetical protein